MIFHLICERLFREVSRENSEEWDLITTFFDKKPKKRLLKRGWEYFLRPTNCVQTLDASNP